MKSRQKVQIIEHEKLNSTVYKLVLKGETSWIENPGQFVNVQVEGCYLRRPLSICDWCEDSFTILYKVIGDGTKKLSTIKKGEFLDVLVGLGNGFQYQPQEKEVLLIGGGIGIPPLYGLAKKLIEQGKSCTIILGFRNKEEMFYQKEFEQLNQNLIICTEDGSAEKKGLVTDWMNEVISLPYYTCGPHGMLKAVFRTSQAQGQLSFEERMGCGFGACMGCSCKTVSGYKRICVEGPVMKSEDLIWTKN